ncbi:MULTISPECIES: hypothetical protein [unclassified Tolypothrix]|uniref:hypothetical protein n=1 Tax=unclassified Tolypothrix TaxID=2649714 RepID=UPI0005EAB7BF|nr:MULTISPECIES: hypothetical protein [unclassified Tolypothrix]BAY94255.1 hypothetical protein NIES3275_63010 [Microchaete diplosiphon NIES-3275]EKF03998.1 hypothetical protein FDUTEX481_03001 [Tolypothrix sp. PCC 7601]MBE9087175.1 hypothetical protein [Tolypothrix sp. LEGE 11397]UYD27997.1 hypothetical protein HGR01_08090 [Tolypothrix sp. PCC 7712]UYD36132.1 hypothetical protein HG267_10540 [Tolypothrix sp. PCC 7601]
MTQAILRLRKLLSSVVPIKRCNLHIILSLKNLQIILSDLSNTGITDKSSGLFGSIERRYFVKLINDHSFRINGPYAYKKLCIETQAQIHIMENINNELIVALKMRPSNRELLILVIMWLLMLSIVITGIIFSWQQALQGSHSSIFMIFMLIMWLTFVSILWYVGITINFQYEAQKIINILKYQLQSK